MSTRLSSPGAKRAKSQHAKCKKEEKSCTPSVFHQVQRSPAICLHVWLSLFKRKEQNSYFDFFTNLCQRDLKCQVIWQTDIVFSQACKCTCLQKVLDSAGVKEKTRTWVRTRAACQLSPRCLFPFSLHALPSSWNAWHLPSFLAKMPFSNREFFLLQLLGKWLASFSQTPCPYRYPEYSVKSTIIGLSRRWVDKNQSLNFLCLSNRQYIYRIYAHIWNHLFLFHYAPPCPHFYTIANEIVHFWELSLLSKPFWHLTSLL